MPLIKDEELRVPLPDEYLIRLPCDIYNTEFYECERPKARFHQLFIFGDYADCNQWKTDYKNCKLWESKRDEKAYEALVESEKSRRFERMKAHYQNNVWKKRDKPPENWNAPLPEWWLEANKYSYLGMKADDIKNGTVNDLDMKVYDACTIL